MRQTLLAALFGAGLGALATWQWACLHAKQTLAAWESAASAQQAAERLKNAAHNDEVIHGWSAAVGVLRARLDAGWQPAIPKPHRLPTGGAPETAPGTDGAAGNDLPTPPGTPPESCANCAAERQQLITDGARCALQVQAWQEWAE